MAFYVIALVDGVDTREPDGVVPGRIIRQKEG
jgi:hypothetical protein